MSNKKRPYRIVNEDTGAEHMVLAISQAQAVSHVARNLFSVTAASGMDVANHAMAGGKIEDATTGASSQDSGDGEDDADEEAGANPGEFNLTRGEPAPVADDGPDKELAEWDQHRSGGIAARAGVED